MVTSTFVFPYAFEVKLPDSSTQTTLKPTARIYLDAEGRTATMYGEGADWQLLDSISHEAQLQTFFTILHQQETEENPTSFVALYADREVLNLGAENNVRVVLATSAPSSTSPKANGK